MFHRRKPPNLTRPNGLVCIIRHFTRLEPRIDGRDKRHATGSLYWTRCEQREHYPPRARPRTDNLVTCLGCTAAT